MEETEEIEVMPEVDLSSDSEEENQDEVSLIVLKRPELKKRQVEEIEIVERSNRDEGDQATFTAKEKTGLIKEYIESEGLAMILSKDIGLVLFHLDSVWIDGRKSTNRRSAKEILKVGTEVTFLVRSFQGEDYKAVSEDGVLHQAVAVWEDRKPLDLLRQALDEENTRQLEVYRVSFMRYVKGEDFLRVALMRVQGEVAGYVSDDIGIIEVYKEKEKINILFHSSDVRIFKKSLDHYRGPCKKNLPVGCQVVVDARKIHLEGVKNCNYQAIIVLAGAWPSHPFPSILRGGNGTYSQRFEIAKGSTAYYLELPLWSRLQMKGDEFATIVRSSTGKLEYDMRDVEYIKDKQDYLHWKHQMGGWREEDRGYRSRDQGPRECLDSFKSCGMVEEEMAVRKVVKEVENRTWYSPETWELGGLRLPKKEEPGLSSSSSYHIVSKRPKLVL